MGLETQKYLRLIIPGVFLYGLLVILCWTTSWCEIVVPQSWEEVSKLLACVVLGAIYSVTGLREISNKFFHLDVDQNITSLLTGPFREQMPALAKANWKEIRHIFYHFVDKDSTLQVKSSIIRFNGLLWTSVADLRVAAIIGVLIMSGSMICSSYSNLTGLKFDEARAGIPILLLVLLFLATFPFSFSLTKKHKRLGNEQCEYILMHYASDLKTMLATLAAKYQ